MTFHAVLVRRIVLVAIAIALGLAPLVAAAAPVTLRFASHAPNGSTISRVLRAWAARIAQRSSGAMTIELQEGGIAGDDRDVLRKIRLGTLDGAVLTGSGLARLSTAFAALEVPMLVETDEEMSYLRMVLGAELRRRAAESQHVLLAWADTGARTLYSRRPVVAIADLRTVRPWTGKDDVGSGPPYRRLGVNAIALGLSEVFPALQVGMVDTFHASPHMTVALQWFHYIRYDCGLPLGPGIGGLVVSQRGFDRLGPALQEILTRESWWFEETLAPLVRAADLASMETLEERGVTTIVPTAELVTAIATEARALAAPIVGEAWMARVEQELAWYRANTR